MSVETYVICSIHNSEIGRQYTMYQMVRYAACKWDIIAKWKIHLKPINYKGGVPVQHFDKIYLK